MKPIKAAIIAAEGAFDAYLRRNKSAAASYVPKEVITAAETAFAEAGGKGRVAVVGYGNPTHPVCGVTVRRA